MVRTLLFGLFFASQFGLFAEEIPNANARVKRVVILGDSITAGYGLTPKEAYPSILQMKANASKLPAKVIGAGVSGDTTAGGLRRVSWALAKGADILIVALGGNDGLRGIPIQETHNNLLGIIQKAKKRNPEIHTIIAGMQMPGNLGPEYTQEFQEIFPKVAKQTNTSLIPFLLKGVGGIAQFNQADGIHPTAEGQIKIAETVWQTLHPLLSQTKPALKESPTR